MQFKKLPIKDRINLTCAVTSELITQLYSNLTILLELSEEIQNPKPLPKRKKSERN
jgi:hypothetical protein